MSTSTPGRDDDAPDLVCQLDAVHGMVEALSSARWKRHQVRRSVGPASPISACSP
jgi:cell cycle checkpoint protein